ncbi:MAG: 4-vinyl reductase [Defluviitaleaceae bacterium]|nr:4-vinyl reductase [Defluviitaleaceae bacterium]
MDNIFETVKQQKKFQWGNLGDVQKGRGDLGDEMPVLVYRLMQFTLLDALSETYGLEEANNQLRRAGLYAGIEFAKNVIDLTLDFNSFISHLQEQLRVLKIGKLRMESFDPNSGDIVLTVAEDLDCSGLPVTNENVCVYDEGFIAGILQSYTKKEYEVREINCWANGDRVCRFKGIQITPKT